MYSLRNKPQKLAEGSLFCLFLKLVQINFIFTDNVRILYIYTILFSTFDFILFSNLRLLSFCSVLHICLHSVRYSTFFCILFGTLKCLHSVWLDTVLFSAFVFMLFGTLRLSSYSTVLHICLHTILFMFTVETETNIIINCFTRQKTVNISHSECDLHVQYKMIACTQKVIYSYK